MDLSHIEIYRSLSVKQFAEHLQFQSQEALVKESCDEFQDIKNHSTGRVGIDDVPEELLQKVKNIDFLWTKINERIDLNKISFTSELQVENFETEFHLWLKKDLVKPSICFEKSIDLYFECSKSNEKWKILGINLNGFNY